MQGALHFILPLAIILFVIYRRFKRTVGFQKLHRRRLIFRIALFSILGLMLLMLGFLHPLQFAADAAGLTAGAGLGLAAIRYTTYEQRVDGWYYRTHLWIQMAVLALFLGRVLYRLAPLLGLSGGGSANPNAADPASMMQDPLTAAVLFVLVSYYLLYFGFLLREEKKLKPDSVEP